MPDEYFSVGYINFVWDDEKNQLNIKKHGIDFRVAAHVFEDDLRLEFIDEEHSEQEIRYDTIGLVDKVLFVVYCDRISDIGNDEIRLISARPATKEEIQMYNEISMGRY